MQPKGYKAESLYRDLNKYDFYITGIQQVSIEAHSPEDAIEQLQDMWNDGEFGRILTVYDYLSEINHTFNLCASMLNTKFAAIRCAYIDALSKHFNLLDSYVFDVTSVHRVGFYAANFNEASEKIIDRTNLAKYRVMNISPQPFEYKNILIPEEINDHG